MKKYKYWQRIREIALDRNGKFLLNVDLWTSRRLWWTKEVEEDD